LGDCGVMLKGKKMFERLINLLNHKALIGVSCPAYILASCLHISENLNADIECIIFKNLSVFPYLQCSNRTNERVMRFCGYLIKEDSFPHDGFQYVRSLAE
jgi:hypothetical protein